MEHRSTTPSGRSHRTTTSYACYDELHNDEKSCSGGTATTAVSESKSSFTSARSTSPRHRYQQQQQHQESNQYYNDGRHHQPQNTQQPLRHLGARTQSSDSASTYSHSMAASSIYSNSVAASSTYSMATSSAYSFAAASNATSCVQSFPQGSTHTASTAANTSNSAHSRRTALMLMQKQAQFRDSVSSIRSKNSNTGSSKCLLQTPTRAAKTSIRSSKLQRLTTRQHKLARDLAGMITTVSRGLDKEEQQQHQQAAARAASPPKRSRYFTYKRKPQHQLHAEFENVPNTNAPPSPPMSPTTPTSRYNSTDSTTATSTMPSHTSPYSTTANHTYKREEQAYRIVNAMAQKQERMSRRLYSITGKLAVAVEQKERERAALTDKMQALQLRLQKLEVFAGVVKAECECDDDNDNIDNDDKEQEKKEDTSVQQVQKEQEKEPEPQQEIARSTDSLGSCSLDLDEVFIDIKKPKKSHFTSHPKRQHDVTIPPLRPPVVTLSSFSDHARIVRPHQWGGSQHSSNHHHHIYEQEQRQLRSRRQYARRPPTSSRHRHHRRNDDNDEDDYEDAPLPVLNIEITKTVIDVSKVLDEVAKNNAHNNNINNSNNNQGDSKQEEPELNFPEAHGDGCYRIIL